MKSTVPLLLAALLCVLFPSVSHAGPIQVALDRVSAEQANPAPSVSRRRLKRGGIILTVLGGGMIVVGNSRTTRDKDPFCGVAFFSDCTVSDPNGVLIGAGAAVVGAGILMIIMGRDKSTPQITFSPGKLAIRHSVTF